MRAVLTTTFFGAVAIALCLGQGHDAAAADKRPSLSMPWKEAGLSPREAAAHLLNRFSFGPRPGEVDEVSSKGLERWFERQLAGNLPDPNLNARLRDLPALAMSETEISRTYPLEGVVLNEARQAGIVTKEMVEEDKAAREKAQTAGAAGAQWQANARPGAAAAAAGEQTPLRQRLMEFARERGYLPERDLIRQLHAQKIYRAVESQNQLVEVMTDFWFNHFNVSLTNNKVRPYLLSYERDAIRPNALGKVRDLLEATARHPAMLLYLDNALSAANPNMPTLMDQEVANLQAQRSAFTPRPLFGGYRRLPLARPNVNNKKAPRGLNENYARELMELHTLGVDGGYSQQDVIEVARAFTGWTVLPAGPAREGAEKRLERVRQMGGMGFEEQGDFLFRADTHDAAPKVVLGQRFPAGRGIEDGEEVLDILAVHSSTARHLSSQLAARFVSDNPPKSLVDHLTAVYLATSGDIRSLLRALVSSPEFWSREAIGAKIKSPFELAVSAVRASGAHVEEPQPLLQWMNRMGQPLYAYQAPTGYPDRAQAWVNTGSLLSRMNFGLQFAAERVRGIDMDLTALHDGREPESRAEALRLYAGLLLPGRNVEQTIKLLTPMVSAPDLAQRVAAVAPREAAAREPAPEAQDEMHPDMREAEKVFRDHIDLPPQARAKAAALKSHDPTPIEQVVGVILGSPEFQRR